MNKRETLWLAYCSPQLPWACWGAPQVHDQNYRFRRAEKAFSGGRNLPNNSAEWRRKATNSAERRLILGVSTPWRPTIRQNNSAEKRLTRAWLKLWFTGVARPEAARAASGVEADRPGAGHLGAEAAGLLLCPGGGGTGQKLPRAASGRAGATTLVRKAAGDYLQALDKSLLDTTGQGLAAFGPDPEALAASQGPTRRPTLVLHQDEGSPGFALSWYILYHLKLRAVVVRDVYHREWNDIKLALKGAKCWWAVLLTTVSLNLAYGPFEGGTWFRKLVEGAEDLFARTTAADPLFCRLYEGLCKDRGMQPTGDPLEKVALLAELETSPLFEAKGKRVALNRWFSWLAAAKDQDAQWHLKLWVILHIGQGSGLYKKRDDMPVFRATAAPPRPTQTADDPTAAGRAQARATSSAASASSAPPADTEAKAPVVKDDKEVQELRGKSQNTLFLAAEVLAREGLQSLVRLVVALVNPIFDEHSQNAREIRGPEASRAWYLEAAKGRHLEVLGQVAKALEEVPTLEALGYDCHFDPARAKHLALGHPDVVKDDLQAAQASTLLCHILAARAASMTWHTEGYPGRIALLLSTNKEEQAAFLARFKADHAAFQAASELQSGDPFLKSALRGSFFHTTLGAELADLLCPKHPTASEGHQLQEAVQVALDLFGGWGQTKVVEDNFHDLREHEQRATASRQLHLARQLVISSSKGKLQEHGRAAWQTQPGPSRQHRLAPDTFLPQQHKPSVNYEDLHSRATWPAYSPQSSAGLPALLALLRDLHAADDLASAKLAWKGALLPLGTVVVPTCTAEPALSLGSPGGVTLLVWALRETTVGATKTYELCQPDPPSSRW